MIVHLNPGSWEAIIAISEAWAWTQARPRFYCATGGEQTIEEYLRAAEAPNVRQMAVTDDGQMVAVVTVRQVAQFAFDLHVTSSRNVKFDLVRDAVLECGAWLFGDYAALTIFTTCPTYNGHIHKGSQRLAEACGMTPTGEVRTQLTKNGTFVTWREYAITREQYYGQSKENINNGKSIPVLSEAGVGRTE